MHRFTCPSPISFSELIQRIKHASIYKKWKLLILFENPSKMKHTKVGWMIYLNHSLSSWGDRMWDFAVGLYLVILHPDSLILTATLGLSVSLGVIIFGSLLGNWIDRAPRLKVATTALFVENSFVILGSILLSFIIFFQAEILPMWSGYFQYFLFSLVILAAVISNLGSKASDIIIERDWIVVLSNGDEQRLSTLNSTMRSIDLTTNILAPLAMGQVLTFGSPLAGAIFIGTWNLISSLIEYYLLVAIYRSVPELGEIKLHSRMEESCSSSNLRDKEGPSSWGLYFKHPVRWAGLAFSLLFLTVMGFDSITLGYIYTQGASESFIGIVTGCGAVCGILGSLAFPHLRSHLGKYTTGNIGFGLNVIFLALCVASVFGPGSPFEVESIMHPFFGGESSNSVHISKSFGELWLGNLNLFYFVIGIVLARFGLWVADLSVTQIIQESVEETRRGVINGVQTSLNQFVDLIKFILIICLPSVNSFGYLIMVSWVAMLLAWILFMIFVCTRESLSRSPSMESLMGEKTPLLSRYPAPTAPPLER